MSSIIFRSLFFTVLFYSLSLSAVYAQENKNLYDPVLAQSLGADDYGMKSYVLVTLLTGDSNITDEQQRNALFRGHFANMNRLAKEKILVVAGPFMEAEPKRGLYIFNVTTLSEAEALVNTDPAVQAGIFKYELTKLYSSAALMTVGSTHKKIQKLAVE
ncbi:YciI family protein [Paraglaciecola sp.]|uniref:YciI family protein n=1 Tax=Paraglaciecola sp. TaxID=1920173 RepID=UPI00273D6C27|nr:YciI family protein [Paraglaciecola sp.]MDP5033180.1 YciI family protein [Paraglaciecola sp.]